MLSLSDGRLNVKLVAPSGRRYHRSMSEMVLWAAGILLVGWGLARWAAVSSIRRLASWAAGLRRGDEGEAPPKPAPERMFRPLVEEILQLSRQLHEARKSAEEEARLRLAGMSRWTAERLREHVRVILHGRSFLVVANREPYTHVKEGGRIKCVTPASGLVTAVEPILRACGGTWIGSAAGDADRETADSQGRIRVPPDQPVYTLRRVWLTEEEEEGYYYGFSNEGLWPLCHIAHTRPVFRVEDWAQYKRVNEKYAQAVQEELAGTRNPFVLIQDYHFALLPRLIRHVRPDAKIAIFWHIPWPNPESFGICPWSRELLLGLLGADLIGFHIQFHCNNFLDTVDRLLESRIDWEQFAVNRAGHRTVVRPFPIGIATAPITSNHETSRQEVMKRLGMNVRILGVGVDRIDYTKGIAERFRAIERFLVKYPEFKENFTFVELAAPSRTLIKRYNDLGDELEKEAQEINQRFQTRTWKPIIFRKEHHNREEIDLFYQASDLCLVTSLHDGMNLVGKEFVWSRADEQGVLVLSRFAGASRQLRDALLVNPYDIEEVAEAIHQAATMPPEEQKTRMARMRSILDEHNVYRWAADITTELDRIRSDAPKG